MKKALFLAAFISFGCFGQSISKPSFEAALVRNERHVPGQEVYTGCRLGPGRLEYTCHGAIPWIIATAYGLTPDQVSGTRAFGQQPRYEIVAKLPRPMDDARRRELLRSFLGEALGVRTHYEKREVSGYFITEDSPDLAAKAAQIAPFEETLPSGDVNSRPSLVSPRSTKTEIIIRLVDAPIGELAQALSLFYGVVIDASNDPRHFDFEFTIRMPSAEDPERERLDASDASAKLKRMGLGVRYRKGLIDFLAIDHVSPEDSFLEK